MDINLVIASSMNLLHMVAMLVWFGGMVTNVFFVIPTADAVLGRTLGPAVMGTFALSMARRSRIPAYVSMGIFILTGVIMGFLNKNSGGIFNYGTAWANLLLTKQILFVMLIILDINMMEVIIPKIAILAPKGPSAELTKLQKRQVAVGMATIIVLALVLVSTAISTAISALS